MGRVWLFSLFLVVACPFHEFTEASMLSMIGTKSKTSFCTYCQILNLRFRIRLYSSPTNEELISMIREHCVLITPSELCHQLLDEFGESIVSTAKVLLQKDVDVCGQYVTGCTNEKSLINSLWDIELPEKSLQQTFTNNTGTQKKLRVLHLTDPHIDYNYTEGSESDCTTKEVLGSVLLCCRGGPTPDVKIPSGKWGMPMHCDPPFRLFENVMKYIKTIENIDYIILTGDYDVHTVWDGNNDRSIQAMLNITQTIKEMLPDIPLYVTIGNHEGDPSDSFPSDKASQLTNISTNPRDKMYQSLNSIMASYITDAQSKNIQRIGSYSIHPTDNLKLILINNNYCSEANFVDYTDMEDPDGVLEWLISELIESELLNENVHIIGHIPPNDNCLKGWSNMYLKIVRRFNNIIKAEFYGHTHHDQFTVYRDDEKAFGSAFISPSFSTYPGQKPAFRIYNLNENYESYTSDVMRANFQGTEPEWYKEYTFKKLYGLADLSHSTLYNLTRFLKNSMYFERYEEFYWKNWKKMCKTNACRMKLRDQLVSTII